MVQKILGFAIVLILFFGSEVNGQKKVSNKNATQSENTRKGLGLKNGYIEDTLLSKNIDEKPVSVLNQLEELFIRMNKYDHLLKRGFDSSEIDYSLSKIENTIRVIDSNLIVGQSISQINLRNISSFKVVMVQFDKQLKGWNNDLESFNASISAGYQDIKLAVQDLTSIHNEDDSLQKVNFKQQLEAIANYRLQLKDKKDSIFNDLLLLEKRVVRAYVKNASLLEDVQFRISKYSTTVFFQSHPPLWKDSRKNFATPLGYDLRVTSERAQNILVYYLKNNLKSVIFLLFFMIVFYYWHFSNKHYLQKNNLKEMLLPLKYIVRFPIFCTIIVVSFLSPYIFISPPAIFVELMWMISAIATTFIFWAKEKANLRLLWILILCLGLLLGIDNLLYDYSIGERWGLLICNFLAVLLAVMSFRKKLITKGKYLKVLQFSLGIILVSNIIAVFLNLFGYFALAKLVSNSAVKQFILAVVLTYVSEIFTEVIYLQLERMKSMQASAIEEYENIRDKFKWYLNVGAVALWFLGFIWSLSFHDIAIQFFADLFDHPISIGSLSFTLNAALVFAITLWVAVIISNFLSVIFGTTEQQFASTKKSKVGSWMMLIRVGIISIGFFIAVGAAGIPLDKLAIVFGALSVGIGFGLQNIVGNLISGVILAFEKPMQVGDVIEIGAQTGTVKQIGIRSSKISTFDGADIIVPNGDFITQKLTNWTHSNSYRRIELIVGVAYGTSLDKVTILINQLLSQRTDVMKYPSHNVIVQGFADSSVNFRILFWTNDFDNWIKLKSDVLKDIYQQFAENGIQIPFPQQDIYIKSLPDNDIIKPA
ncbi:MAG: mechanosensitive ion channel domain-containing protein [Sphingobacteriia bacterium]|jgi:small-conductance mechanosensitive channel/vacuolar-type H+-ATPase subunit D/Vma8